MHADVERLVERGGGQLKLRGQRRVVALRGRGYAERYERDRAGIVKQQTDGDGHVLVAELERFGLAGRRVRHGDGHRARSKRCLQLVEVLAQGREALVAGGLAGAALDNAIQGALGLRRDLGAQRHLRWHDTIDNDRPRRVGEPPCVMLRDARAVRRAVQVQRLVTQGDADGFEVPDGDAGREEARVVRQRVQAFLDGPQDPFPREVGFAEVVLGFAGHRRRFSGAALIHEQDVAVLLHAPESVCPARVKTDRRSAGTAGDRHESVRGRLERQGGHDRDLQRDRACVGRVRIQRPLELSATGGNAGAAGPGADAAVFQHHAGPGHRRGQQQRQ